MARFLLPDLGEGLEEAQLVQWLVGVGDQVHLNQPICQVETAKALVDVPSPYVGVVEALHAAPGETVPVGAPLITIAVPVAPAGEGTMEGSGPVLVGYGSDAPAQTFTRRRRGAAAAHLTASAPTGAASATQPAHAGAPLSATQASATPRPAHSVTDEPDLRASPLVRKIATERGIDLRAVTGSGPGGRIRVEDLEAATTTAPRPAASTTRSPTPLAEDEERISTVGLRKAIAARMVRSATTISQFTEYGLFDATELVALRERLRADAAFADVRLTYLPFLVAALVGALREFPIMNSRWDEEGNAIIVKRSLHIGIATDTERGLLVPVIHDAQTRSLRELAVEAERLIGLARAGRLDVYALSGSTITVTNVGAAGPVETGAPLINPPEVCVVGIGAIKLRPTVVGDRVEARPGAWLSMSCDHRVVDGATAARFMTALARRLEAPEPLAESGPRV